MCTLALSDGIGQIVSMQLLAADEAQARTMEHYFKWHTRRMSIRHSCVCSQKARKSNRHEYLHP